MPIDQTDLVMTERQGVEIDYCPQCRGVWLNRGELDKIIERSVQLEGSGSYRNAPSQSDCGDRDGYRQGHKRRGWLGELFD